MKIDSNLLTATECAKYLGVSVSSFYKIKKKYPDLPYVSLGKNMRRYYRGEEVKNFLLSRAEKGGDISQVELRQEKNITRQK